MGQLIDTEIIQECTRLSFEEVGAFPEVIKRLSASGIERYRADLIRREKTYYDTHGNSHIESQPLELYPVSDKFSESDLKVALQVVQNRKIGYREFVTKIMTAGVASIRCFSPGGEQSTSGGTATFTWNCFRGRNEDRIGMVLHRDFVGLSLYGESQLLQMRPQWPSKRSSRPSTSFPTTSRNSTKSASMSRPVSARGSG